MKKTLLAFSIPLLFSASVFAQDSPIYFVKVPVKLYDGSQSANPNPSPETDPVSLTLDPQALPAGTVGEVYSFNLADRLSIAGGKGSYNIGDVVWTIKAGDLLPPGLTLENGTIAGTPTTKNEAGTPFEVTGTYQDASGKQIYTIVVGGQVLHVTQISSGDYHTCAVTTSGGAKCWGDNFFGQLGDGTDTEMQTLPVSVLGLESGVASISAGGMHTCAVMASGQAKCWGENSNGQLGDGTTETHTAPVNVSGLATGVKHISAGGLHSCAVLTSGGALCWGSGASGRLGNNGTEDRLTPAEVMKLPGGVSSISAGNTHTCAVTNAGGAKCWGDNWSGQLGNGSNINALMPSDVSGLLSGVSAISVGHHHTCALTTAGGAKCWGWDVFGQLGDGGSNTNTTTPVDVAGLNAGVASLSVGGSHACVVTTTGGVKCWGAGAYGRLGNGSTDNQSTPVDVVGLTTGASSVEAGDYNACAMTNTGQAKCWGSNDYGQLGDGSTNLRTTPVAVQR